MKRSRQIHGVAPLFAFPTSKEVQAGGCVTDVVRSRARKCALASLCIFQKTRVRRAAVKWHETDRIPAVRGRQLPSVRSRVSFRASRTIPKCRQPDSYDPRTFSPLLYSVRFITFAIFRREARPKVANADIIRRKPLLRRFERLTAMRAISNQGWLSTGHFER